tara:strand:- start:1 stop:393 length:393 start_codon:yes stop_codon:yes gene_type:complete
MQVVGTRSILWVADFRRMSDFYSRVLGLSLIEGEDSEGWIQFRVGDGKFAPHAIPPEYLSHAGEPSAPTIRWDSAVKNVFYLSDLEIALAKLATNDVQRAPGDHPEEGYLDFLDPEGNVFQIAQAGFGEK